jgi:anaerobic ribonucleoside-triphosphate reductase activating protein
MNDEEYRSMIRVADVIEDSIVDGPGLRFVVFVQGCDKRCEGCHNPEAQLVEGGALYSASELLARVAANPLCMGVTLSGGEPLLQAEVLLPFARGVKVAGLSLAVYSGDTIERILERNDAFELALLSLADVLVDGPFVLAERSLALPFRGSRGQRLLDGRCSVSEGRAVPSNDPSWSPVKV